MSFLDSKDQKYVPLYVMEDLLAGDRRLLTKLFYSLIRYNKENQAKGLYDRHDFYTWSTAETYDIASKVKYDHMKDQIPLD